MTHSHPAHVRQTEAFVAENPVDIVITPRAKEATGAGGHRWVDQPPLPSQRVRLVAIGRVTAVATRTTEDGRVVTPTHTLIAVPGTVVNPMDKFSVGSDQYEVVTVSSKPEWRVSAEVVAHA